VLCRQCAHMQCVLMLSCYTITVGMHTPELHPLTKDHTSAHISTVHAHTHVHQHRARTHTHVHQHRARTPAPCTHTSTVHAHSARASTECTSHTHTHACTHTPQHCCWEKSGRNTQDSRQIKFLNVENLMGNTVSDKTSK